MSFLNALNGHKTYIAAAGLIFPPSTGQVPQGLQALLTALATAGLRNAIGSAKS